VVRCFVDDDVAHVAGKIDPIADIDTIETELMLADLDSLEKTCRQPQQKGEGQRPRRQEAKTTSSWSTRHSCSCAMANPPAWSSARQRKRKRSHARPLDRDPMLYVCNVDEESAATGNEFSHRVEARARDEGAACVVISAKIEAEIAVLPPAERVEYLAAIGLKEAGLDRLIRAGYALLI